MELKIDTIKRKLIQSREKYFEAVKSLYPQGLFFEKQFEDDNSDLSKIAKCQAKNIYELQKEIYKLWLEARLETCTEDTIEDYERIIIGYTTEGLSLFDRKVNIICQQNQLIKDDLSTNQIKLILLSMKEKSYMDKDTINEIIKDDYQANIIDIEYKFDCSAFGHAQCGHTQLYNYHAFSVVLISLTIEKEERKKELESFLKTFFTANKIIFFDYTK